MNGAETTINFLRNHGVSHVFGMPGGANLPLYDALSRSDVLSILARHEQGAAFMAQGYARKTGKPGVCFATSGPGAANLLTAIADAKSDSVPVVAITGQVPRHLRGTDAFQELDVMALARPITKAACAVEDARDLPRILETAFDTAASGRPGPVWIDIPRDVQLAKVEPQSLSARKEIRDAVILPEQIEQFERLLSQAERPLLYFGGGVAHSGAADLLREFARSSGIPAVSSINGLGVFPHSEPLYAGFVGVYGFPAANRAVRACDLLIAVGARFDDRATGPAAKFCPGAAIVHVDIDARELGKILRPALPIQAAAAQFLDAVSGMKAPRAPWQKEIRAWKEESPSGLCSLENPEYVLSLVNADHFAAITTDVGLHQMWAARSLQIPEVRHFLTSGGMGTMGFGLPAAIGASFASGEAPVLCITGDGSLLLNIQELSVVAEYGLPVKILLFDNGHLGMVRSQQHSQFEGRIISSRFNGAPAFGDLARAFGIAAVDACTSETQLREALYADGPALIRIEIDAMLDVSNKTAPARFTVAGLSRSSA